MNRNLLLGIPVLIAVAVIFLPVLNPDLVPVNEERCGEYCEYKTDCLTIIQTQQLVRIPAQPVNTWSNIAFLIAGFFVFRGRKTVVGTWFALSCVVLGLGSGAFHSFMSNGGHFWDLVGMFLVFNFLAVYSMFVTHKLKNYVLSVVISAVLSLLTALFITDLSSTLIIGVAGITLLVHLALAAINGRVTWKKAGLTILPFAVAFVFRQMDVADILCNPQSFYQGHAVWHVLAAVGIYGTFRLLEDMRIEAFRVAESP